METRKRTLVKGLVWRCIAIVASFLVALAVVGSWGKSVELTVWGNVVSATLYYFHERFWTRCRWGRV